MSNILATVPDKMSGPGDNLFPMNHRYYLSSDWIVYGDRDDIHQLLFEFMRKAIALGVMPASTHASRSPGVSEVTLSSVVEAPNRREARRLVSNHRHLLGEAGSDTKFPGEIVFEGGVVAKRLKDKV